MDSWVQDPCHRGAGHQSSDSRKNSWGRIRKKAPYTSKPLDRKIHRKTTHSGPKVVQTKNIQRSTKNRLTRPTKKNNTKDIPGETTKSRSNQQDNFTKTNHKKRKKPLKNTQDICNATIMINTQDIPDEDNTKKMNTQVIPDGTLRHRSNTEDDHSKRNYKKRKKTPLKN